MSTEQQPASPAPASPAPATPPAVTPPPPKAEPNALAQALTGGWEKFKQGQLISYPLMALLLLLVTGVGVTWWVLHERGKTRSGMWVEYDEAARLNSAAELDAYAKKYPDSRQAKLAALEIARGQLGPDGIDKLTVRAADIGPAAGVDPDAKARETRAAAVKNVEAAREAFAGLADDFKDDPVLRAECLFACGQAEAALIGYPKEGQTINPLDPQAIEARGDPKKAVEWLRRAVEAAPDTDWGKRAKATADALENPKTAQDFKTIQASVYDASAASGFGAPVSPGGFGPGGFGPGGFGPPGGP